jgi:hypothetical protein
MATDRPVELTAVEGKSDVAFLLIWTAKLLLVHAGMRLVKVEDAVPTAVFRCNCCQRTSAAVSNSNIYLLMKDMSCRRQHLSETCRQQYVAVCSLTAKDTWHYEILSEKLRPTTLIPWLREQTPHGYLGFHSRDEPKTLATTFVQKCGQSGFGGCSLV